MYIVKKIIDFVMDVLETITFVGSIFIVIYLFIMQPNQVKGSSMEPGLTNGDYIFTSKITYKFRPIERGDIIVFKAPPPTSPDIEYIKRVVGLPGDRVMIKNSNVYVNDILLNEAYIYAKTNVIQDGFLKEGEEYTVPSDKLIVFGDNRPRSSDSREFGAIRISTIIGQVFYRYFPFNKIGSITDPFPSNLRTDSRQKYNLYLTRLNKLHYSS